MMFYLALIAVALVSFSLLVLPFVRGGRSVASASEHAREVYAAQMREIEGDLERGLLSPDEASGAKAEIGRRLLKAVDEAEKKAKAAKLTGTGKRLTALGVMVALLVPIYGFSVYFMQGRPDLATERLPSDMADISSPQELVRVAEARMRQNPDDARGWDILGRTYITLARFRDAQTAFERAIRTGGQNADRLTYLAEARIMLASGMVEADVYAMVEAALAEEPDHAKAISFLALAEEQAANWEEAIIAWQRLRDLEGADVRYVALAEARLEAIAAMGITGAEE